MVKCINSEGAVVEEEGTIDCTPECADIVPQTECGVLVWCLENGKKHTRLGEKGCKPCHEVVYETECGQTITCREMDVIYRDRGKKNCLSCEDVVVSQITCDEGVPCINVDGEVDFLASDKNANKY